MATYMTKNLGLGFGYALHWRRFLIVQQRPLGGSLLDGSDAMQRHPVRQVRGSGGGRYHEAQAGHAARQLPRPVCRVRGRPRHEQPLYLPGKR